MPITKMSVFTGNLARAAPVTCASCGVATPVILQRRLSKYGRVSFYDGSFYDVSFYDDLLLLPPSSRTEHSRLVVHHCRNPSVLSLLSALRALFRCACVSSFSILVQFFSVDCDFSAHDVHQKDRKEKKSKQLTLHYFLMSSEPRRGPSSTK
jgi:hypothetical protein